MLAMMMVAALSFTSCGDDDNYSTSGSTSGGTSGGKKLESSVTTLIVDIASQPMIAGGYINNYAQLTIKKKGLIISKNISDMYVTDDTQMDIPTKVLVSNRRDYNSPMNLRYLDCSKINEEEFLCELLYLEGNTDYYVKAFAITANGNVLYGETVKVHSKTYNRYDGRADVANVWHAFDYTLFDLISEEIINPSNGFYYSTNENPRTVRHQVGTRYNTCYKFSTEWNYKLWYYNNENFNDIKKMVSIPKMRLSNGKLEITKAESDNDKSITIYYSVGGNGNLPETFTDKYSEPISVNKGDMVYCYAISSDGFISFTNQYKVVK